MIRLKSINLNLDLLIPVRKPIPLLVLFSFLKIASGKILVLREFNAPLCLL